MKKFVAKKTCYWGPQPGTETIYHKGDVILAYGSEPCIDEFFEPVEAEAPKKGKGKGAGEVDL